MRVVLDTNVFLSGAIAKTGPIAFIMTAWSRAAFDAVVSRPLMDEIIDNIHGRYFATRLSPAARQDHLRTIAAGTTLVQLPPAVPSIATHPEDDLILATAVAGAVDYLVTGDRQLLALGIHEGIPIVSPADFVKLLDLQP
jgi:putative PIN family toxin of toxin-antitoxin system